jgi:hypothetical protein
MKAYSLGLFFICFNIAFFLFQVTGATLTLGVPSEGYFQWNDIGSYFKIVSWDMTSLAFSAVAIVGSIASFIMGHSLLGYGAIVLWVLSIILVPVRWIANGFPLMMKGLAQLMSAPSVFVDFIIPAITVPLAAYTMFMFFLEIASQRQLT